MKPKATFRVAYHRSRITGKGEGHPLGDEYLVFEALWTSLSAVTLGVTGNGDCLVLNSVANVEKAMGHLEGTGASAFLDRDKAGRRALAALDQAYGEACHTHVPPSITAART